MVSLDLLSIGQFESGRHFGQWYLMTRFYNTISPIFLLTTGWVFLGLAMAVRIWSGQSVPYLNLLFVLASLAIYFFPEHLAELNKGEGLRRKLLWLLILAGFLMLAGESIRAMTGNTEIWPI